MEYPLIRPTNRAWQRTKTNSMKTKRWTVGLLVAGTAALATGCAEQPVVYVPVYSAPPAYVYSIPPPVATPPGAVPVATNIPAATVVIPTVTVTTVAPMAPPAPQVEVIPVAPSPDYVWVSGYWGWTGGAWVWIRGGWVVRPAVSAVWVNGYWARHGRTYIWVGGHWR